MRLRLSTAAPIHNLQCKSLQFANRPACVTFFAERVQSEDAANETQLACISPLPVFGKRNVFLRTTRRVSLVSLCSGKATGGACHNAVVSDSNRHGRLLLGAWAEAAVARFVRRTRRWSRAQSARN